MKKILKISITLMFVISMLAGCNNDNENNMIDNINIEVCGVKNPNWLVNQVSKILNKTSNYRPVEVLVYKNENAKIIAIEDPTNSNMAEFLMFFDCMGNKTDYSSLQYKEYSQLLKNDKFIRLWSN